MASLLRRTSARLTCFFCQSAISPPPPSPRSFLCPHCKCWNRYDHNGDIMSDDPAMHDEAMNSSSFARRASPRKDRFPTTFGAVTFCTTCQTNQRLVISLLSSYLPPSEDDPGYARRLESYPAYRDSVYARYPQVCDECAPLVDAEIRKKDSMARADALGRSLKQTKGLDSRRLHSPGSRFDRHKLERELKWWRLRGVLWGVTMCGAMALDAAAATDRLARGRLVEIAPASPIFMLLSILWAAWHPTYASLRRAELQGRKVRVRGREDYTRLQGILWLCRTVTAALVTLAWYNPSWDYLSLRHVSPSPIYRIYFFGSLCLELSVLVRSFFVLRLHQPPSVRLLDTATPASTSSSSSRSRSSTPLSFPSSFPASMQAAKSRHLPAEMLDSLTLSGTSGAPHASRQTSPVFGVPSFSLPKAAPTSGLAQDDGNHTPPDVDMEADPDAMDWTPTSPNVRALPVQSRADAWAGEKAAVFRPSDQSTGLEGLLERTNLVEKDPRYVARRNKGRSGGGSAWWSLAAILLAVVLACAGAGAYWNWSGRFGLELQPTSPGTPLHVAIEATE
ncbi:hypothetical protein FA95DRAFT_1491034 [Auriscalpium vulgare]|uniref:Uncharacterized protein n=1 Tax=Auriscalpium vulgare TaxID=40419 RepID=A0ACB8RVP9_9AGAM|nr:hypothetical protein FA95DRAFT_1491034 [Auriscalpium vulgare]